MHGTANDRTGREANDDYDGCPGGPDTGFLFGCSSGGLPLLLP